MYSLRPNEVSVKDLYGFMDNTIGPRPIALVSTINKEGRPNLSPFSSFNFIGVNPPTLVFSTMQSLEKAEKRDTLDNVEDVKEVVVNMVTYAMIQQTFLAGTDYDENVNEFNKAGFTMLDAEVVRPKRVSESPVQYECNIKEIYYTGKDPAAGSLVICEVLKLHIDETVLVDKKIDQEQLDYIGRMGNGWFTRAKSGMFEVSEQQKGQGIGVDELPKDIKRSIVLTGNDLGKLGSINKVPESRAVRDFIDKNDLEEFINESSKEKTHAIAQEYLRKDDVLNAWHILLAKQKK